MIKKQAATVLPSLKLIEAILFPVELHQEASTKKDVWQVEARLCLSGRKTDNENQFEIFTSEKRGSDVA